MRPPTTPVNRLQLHQQTQSEESLVSPSPATMTRGIISIFNEEEDATLCLADGRYGVLYG